MHTVMSGAGTRAELSPAAAVRRHAVRRGEAVALVYRSPAVGGAAGSTVTEVSYRELDDRSGRLARALVDTGVEAGDRVAYLGLNSPALISTLLACSAVGAVFVPVNHRLSADEVADVLADCDPRVVVAEAGQEVLADAVVPGLAVKAVLGVGEDGRAPGARPPLGAEPVPVGEDTLAALLYTSGSTGRPKGVVLTHGNLWWNCVNVWSSLDTRPDDVVLVAAPMFHIGGLNALTLPTLLRGGTVVVHRAFDPRACLDALVTHGVTGFFGVPAMFAALADLPEFPAADLSRLRCAVVAGAPVPPRLIRRYAGHGVLLQQAWGLTETAPFATYLPPEETGARTGSAGVAMPYTQVRVADPADPAASAAPRVPGEILVRGPNVTPGYWNNAEATALSFTEDGWFRTGDIGHLDEDGYLWVVDRLKEMIISGGENIYPAEVERHLTELPGIRDAAVIGVPDPTWGETVAAVVVPEDGGPALDAVRDALAARLARYKLPRVLVTVPALPRNGSGKTDKPELRRWARAGTWPAGTRTETTAAGSSREDERNTHALAAR
ncbi:long-chain fatty acid--CoA ligase [Streptomyces sp. NBC_00249]|uniref:acyl-CoA synthetase n=1 Tax=Streptomyces sp. NBC_00249 TaxID=2975690 RepID=UPI0022508532|nr:long-chain fatty acid--CoA ligase [Streptomyces sp. NBC_00249]MCX5192894.1 long-chain fatty acid--CoA ligase [Streptomyces sp. NBC_00249]